MLKTEKKCTHCGEDGPPVPALFIRTMGVKGTPIFVGRRLYEGYEEAKPHIFKKYGFVCQECGKSVNDETTLYGYTSKLSEWDFVVHHIDGDSRNQCWDNLTVLCTSCNRKKQNRFNYKKKKE
jgi:hypothetical protein